MPEYAKSKMVPSIVPAYTRKRTRDSDSDSGVQKKVRSKATPSFMHNKHLLGSSRQRSRRLFTATRQARKQASSFIAPTSPHTLLTIPNKARARQAISSSFRETMAHLHVRPFAAPYRGGFCTNTGARKRSFGNGVWPFLCYGAADDVDFAAATGAAKGIVREKVVIAHCDEHSEPLESDADAVTVRPKAATPIPRIHSRNEDFGDLSLPFDSEGGVASRTASPNTLEACYPATVLNCPLIPRLYHSQPSVVDQAQGAPIPRIESAAHISLSAFSASTFMPKMEAWFRDEWHKIQIPSHPDNLRNILLARGLKPCSVSREALATKAEEKTLQGSRLSPAKPGASRTPGGDVAAGRKLAQRTNAPVVDKEMNGANVPSAAQSGWQPQLQEEKRAKKEQNTESGCTLSQQDDRDNVTTREIKDGGADRGPLSVRKWIPPYYHSISRVEPIQANRSRRTPKVETREIIHRRPLSGYGENGPYYHSIERVQSVQADRSPRTPTSRKVPEDEHESAPLKDTQSHVEHKKTRRKNRGGKGRSKSKQRIEEIHHPSSIYDGTDVTEVTAPPQTLSQLELIAQKLAQGIGEPSCTHASQYRIMGADFDLQMMLDEYSLPLQGDNKILLYQNALLGLLNVGSSLPGTDTSDYTCFLSQTSNAACRAYNNPFHRAQDNITPDTIGDPYIRLSQLLQTRQREALRSDKWQAENSKPPTSNEMHTRIRKLEERNIRQSQRINFLEQGAAATMKGTEVADENVELQKRVRELEVENRWLRGMYGDELGGGVED